MKFWAVEQGSYSDYNMGPFFTTKELAEAYIDRHCPHADRDKCYCDYFPPSEFEILDALPKQALFLFATIDVDGKIALGPEVLREEPLEYSRREVYYATVDLQGPKDRVLKVAGEISAERKAWAAGIADPPPGWPPERYHPPVPPKLPESGPLGRYPDAFFGTPTSEQPQEAADPA